MKVIGEEISSYMDDLAFALTNPVFTSPMGYEWKRDWTPTQKKWREYMKEGIIYNGNRYMDVEQAYQMSKAKFHPGKNLLGLPTTEDLMIELITIKLSNYPLLVEEIDKRGGIEYILTSTHQPTKKGSYWETSGGNGFIKCLAIAYIDARTQIKEK